MRSSVHFAAPNFNKNLNLLSEMCSRGEIREFTVQLHFFFLAPRCYSEAMKDFFLLAWPQLCKEERRVGKIRNGEK